MNTQPYISVIFPIYNEESRLGMALAHTVDYFWNYTHLPFEVIGVLNGCTDRSEDIINMFYENWVQFKIIKLPKPGKGAAVKAGMLAAAGKYRYMADVDLSTPIHYISALVSAANHSGSGVVIGQRIINYDTKRKLAHWGYKLLAKPLINVPDPQSGFKLFTADCANYVFNYLTVSGWGWDVEALHLAKRGGYKITSVPVPWIYDKQSKINLVKDGLQMARDLIKLRFKYI